MDIRNFQTVNYKTKYNWSNSIKGQLKIVSKKTERISDWNILPMSDKFEYSKQLFTK